MDTLRSAHEIDFARRFGGVARLYGGLALERFSQAHVCVIGLGGVGSWTVEALARSAIGRLTLIDVDHVAESNINRQAHALDSTLGMAKVAAMAERIRQINPFCSVQAIEEFAEPGNVAMLLRPNGVDYVVDAIDSVKDKVALILWCRAHAVPLVTIGSAGGQTDATRVRVKDLAHTEHEPLLARVRKRLRGEHGFPRDIKTKFGIDAVYSDEPLIYPAILRPELKPEICALVSDDIDAARTGTARDPAPGEGITGLNCAGFGSSVAVTAVFGFIAAGHVLKRLADSKSKPRV